MYDIDKIYEANSVREAIALLTEHPEAKVIAGGSDVLIKIREGKMAGCTLVSIYGLDELRGVTMLEDGTVRIGALTSFSDVA
ncbi:MAG: FAD binding domain-containing protein, partial [Clostridia bacterium]